MLHDFHSEHDLLKDNFKPAMDAHINTFKYICMLLHVGLPNDFESPGTDEGSDGDMEMPNSARSGRSSVLDADKHLEIALVTDLNTFFNEREMPLDEMCSSIRQAIRCNQKTEAFQ
jgi:hypothetical protein